MRKLLEILKKDNTNKEVLKTIKEEIKKISTNEKKIEELLELMDKLKIYIGFDRDVVNDYLKILGIDLMEKKLEKNLNRSMFYKLEKLKKLKYLNIILYYEIKLFKEIIEKREDDLIKKMLKFPEYQLIDFLIKEEKKPTENKELDELAKELKRQWEYDKYGKN
ncbi:hypothetical protein ACIE8Z_07825 [Cetobacterium somerae ATCC BAA-474]